jgi:hypothetical protein
VMALVSNLLMMYLLLRLGIDFTRRVEEPY